MSAKISASQAFSSRCCLASPHLTSPVHRLARKARVYMFACTRARDVLMALLPFTPAAGKIQPFTFSPPPTGRPTRRWSASRKIHFPFKEESEIARACQYGDVRTAAGGKRGGRACTSLDYGEGGGEKVEGRASSE